MFSPWPEPHFVTLTALWRKTSASWWNWVCHPMWPHATTGGGVLLEFLMGRPRGSGEACVPPRKYPCPTGWSHLQGKGVLPHVSADPGYLVS